MRLEIVNVYRYVQLCHKKASIKSYVQIVAWWTSYEYEYEYSTVHNISPAEEVRLKAPTKGM